MPGSAFGAPGGAAALTTFVLTSPCVSAVEERFAWMARNTTASARRSAAVRLDGREVRRLPVTARTRVGILRNLAIASIDMEDDADCWRAQILVEQSGYGRAASSSYS